MATATVRQRRRRPRSSTDSAGHWGGVLFLPRFRKQLHEDRAQSPPSRFISIASSSREGPLRGLVGCSDAAGEHVLHVSIVRRRQEESSRGQPGNLRPNSFMGFSTLVRCARAPDQRSLLFRVGCFGFAAFCLRPSTTPGGHDSTSLKSSDSVTWRT